MHKTVTIEGKEISFAVNASTNRIYHDTFNRDMGDDIKALAKAIQKATKAGKTMIARVDAAFLQNLMWCAAKTANSEAPNIYK